MIYIDINRLNPSKKWLDKSEELLQELKNCNNKEERDRIIDEASSQSQWKALKEKLKALSYGKCWYSEAREIFSHYHVDHFRPKKRAIDDTNGERNERDGYWWLTFEYKNYRLSASVGNTKKSYHFAVLRNAANNPDESIDDEIIYLLDPTKRGDPNKLIVDEEGKIKPANPNVNAWDHKRADYTIEKLHLNYPDLRTERQVKWDKVQRLIYEVDNLDAKYQQIPSAVDRTKLEDKINEIIKHIAPCSELSATARACLRASRKQWALELLETQIDINEFCNECIQV